MRRIRATREVYYASKTRQAGEEFDADDSEARLLVGLEKAEYVNVEEKKPAQPTQEAKPQALETRALKADEASGDDQSEKPAPEVLSTESAPEITEGGRRSRRYMRRDMKAKE